MRPNPRRQLPARFYVRRKSADAHAEKLRSLGYFPKVQRFNGRWMVAPYAKPVDGRTTYVKNLISF